MKHLVFLLFLLPMAAMGQELIVEYNFNSDKGDSVTDTSGNNLHGHILGSGTNHFGAGFSRNGLKLNGVDNHVLVPDDNLFDLDQFTLASWVRFSKSSWDREEIMEKAGVFWINIRQDTRKVRAGGRFGGCDVKPYGMNFDSVDSVSLDTWTHVAVTYDGYTLKIYINGILSGENDVPVAGRICANAEPLSIGSKYKTLPPRYEGAYFKGVLDAVRIFDTALSEARIRQEMFKN